MGPPRERHTKSETEREKERKKAGKDIETGKYIDIQDSVNIVEVDILSACVIYIL